MRQADSSLTAESVLAPGEHAQGIDHPRIVLHGSQDLNGFLTLQGRPFDQGDLENSIHDCSVVNVIHRTHGLYADLAILVTGSAKHSSHKTTILLGKGILRGEPARRTHGPLADPGIRVPEQGREGFPARWLRPAGERPNRMRSGAPRHFQGVLEGGQSTAIVQAIQRNNQGPTKAIRTRIGTVGQRLECRNKRIPHPRSTDAPESLRGPFPHPSVLVTLKTVDQTS